MHIRITLPTSRRIRTLKGTNTHAAIKLLDRTLERQPDDAQARWVLQVALGTQDDRRFEVTPKAAARTSTTLMVHSSEDRRSDHILNDRFCGWDGHAYAGEDCTTCQVAATVTGTTRWTERRYCSRRWSPSINSEKSGDTPLNTAHHSRPGAR